MDATLTILCFFDRSLTLIETLQSKLVSCLSYYAWLHLVLLDRFNEHLRSEFRNNDGCLATWKRSQEIDEDGINVIEWQQSENSAALSIKENLWIQIDTEEKKKHDHLHTNSHIILENSYFYIHTDYREIKDKENNTI